MIPYELEEKLLYRKEQEEIRQDMREIEKTRLKTEITESIRTRAQEIRRWNKENADERKRGQYETVDFTPNGDIRVLQEI